MSRCMRIVTGCLMAVAVSAAATTLTADDGVRTVQIRDDCDPATFDAAVGPGTCVGDGDTTFQDFIAELQATQVAEKWRFNPSSTNDTSLLPRNRGGETHTFTPVAKFGGGVVPVLNTLSGNPVEAPECADPTQFGPSVLPSGATAKKTITAKPGDHFQCCIHPWMRLTVTK